MRDTYIWKERLQGRNIIHCYQDRQEELKNGDTPLNACYIEADVDLNDALLLSLHERLSDGAEVYIVRNGKKLNLQQEGLLLIKHGFVHVVQLRKKEHANTFTIHCIKEPLKEQLLSVIIPLYNEENTAKELLETLFNHHWNIPHEFIIVESNSQDGTRKIVESYAEREDVRIVLEDKPNGKGNGVLLGIKHASGQFIAIQDGDLEYDVNDYDRLLPPLFNHETLFMLGSRYEKGNFRMRKFSDTRSVIEDYLNLGQKLLTGILNVACGCKLTDPFTMYKIFHKDCMYGINFVGGNFGLDWEIVIRFVRKGCIPTEIPVSYQARSYADGKHIALFGTPIEGLKALWHCRFRSKVYDYGDE